MDATIQIVNVKIVTAEAIAPAEVKFNSIKRGQNYGLFFL